MSELAFILDVATGGIIGIWLSCYRFIRKSIERTANAKIERRSRGRR